MFSFSIGGLDFNVITNYKLIFSLTVHSHDVPLIVPTDGLLEQDEAFSAALSTSNVRLQLQENVESVVLQDTICQGGDGRNLFSISNDTDEVDKRTDIDFGLIILTKTSDGIRFSLANSEINRVSVATSSSKVTILDNDSKTNQYEKPIRITCMYKNYIMLFFFLLDVTVGFNKNSYSVNECDGNVSIGITVEGSELQREVIVYLSTIDQTAFGKITV